MSGLILPDGAKNETKKDDDKVDIDSLTEEERARLIEMAGDIDPDEALPKADFVFTVIKTSEGYAIDFNPEGKGYRVDSVADEEDVLAAASVISATINAQITAAATAQAMTMQAMAMQRQMQDASLRQRLGV